MGRGEAFGGQSIAQAVIFLPKCFALPGEKLFLYLRSRLSNLQAKHLLLLVQLLRRATMFSSRILGVNFHVVITQVAAPSYTRTMTVADTHRD